MRRFYHGLSRLYRRDCLYRVRTCHNSRGVCRYFSPAPPDKGTAEGSKKEETNTSNSTSVSDTVQDIGKTSLTGVGQVIFLNSPQCGGIILASLAIGNPYLASLAAAGAVTSTATAKALQLDPAATSNGLLTYNGALVGCATAVFLVPLAQPQPEVAAAALAITSSGAVTTTLLSVSLGQHFFTQQPQWTYAFNLVTMPMLLRHHALQQQQQQQQQADMLVSTASSTDIASAAAATTTTTTTVAAASTSVSPSLLDVVLLSPFTGLSQIFVVEHAGTGLGIAAAISLYSPKLAGHALLGSVMGSVTGYLALGAPLPDIVQGLWGYNGVLVSMAVDVFSIPTRQSLALSAGGAAASSVLFGAFSFVNVPCLTLPFCLTTTALYPLLLQQRVPGLAVAKDPHSPERNAVS